MSVEIAQELVRHLETIVGGHEEAHRSLQETRDDADRIHKALVSRMMGEVSDTPFDFGIKEDSDDPDEPARRRIAINRALMQLFAHEEVRSQVAAIYDLLNREPEHLTVPPIPDLSSPVPFFEALNAGLAGHQGHWDELIRQENEREIEALQLAREVLAKLLE